jgi:HlyD family secretion protein
VKRVPALLVTGLLVSACSGDADPRVQTAEVDRATVAEVVEAPGAVGARATAALSAPADATVAEVLVEDGAQVAAGAVLVRLSSTSAQDRLASARSALARAEDADVPVPRADLRPLQDSLDAAAGASFAAGRSAAGLVTEPQARARALSEVDEAERRYAASSAAARATLDQVDASAAGLEQALAAVTASQRASARAAVVAAQATVDALTVTAPIAGVVTLGAGEAPAAGGDELAGLVEGLPEAVRGSAE